MVSSFVVPSYAWMVLLVPSGLDVASWKKLCTAFWRSSDSLCSLSAVSRRLATAYVHFAGLSAFTACYLTALNKHPCVIVDLLELVRFVGN